MNALATRRRLHLSFDIWPLRMLIDETLGLDESLLHVAQQAQLAYYWLVGFSLHTRERRLVLSHEGKENKTVKSIRFILFMTLP